MSGITVTVDELLDTNSSTSDRENIDMSSAFQEFELSNVSNAWWFWYLKLLFSLFIALFGGYSFVGYLRYCCKKTDVIWKLTLTVFSAPILVFLMSSICADYKLCDRFVADSFSFGVVTGMLLKLISKPSGEKIVKLVVQQVLIGDAEGRDVRRDVWLNSVSGSIQEVRDRIAEALGIVPSERVTIESGRGKFFEDLSQPFFAQLDDAHKSTDFFGFVTASCYISVEEAQPEEEEEEEVAPTGAWNQKRNKKINPFKALIDSRVKYGDPCTFTGRSAASDDAKGFHVASVEKFAGAALGSAPLFVQLKLLAWSALHIAHSESSIGLEDDSASAALSQQQQQQQQQQMGAGGGLGGSVPSVTTGAADTASEGESSVATRKSGGMFSLFRRKTPDPGQMKGKPIHDGDSVVIEAEGRYLSVTRGWWLAWSSPEPRYSGAFEIEIMERAPQNIKLLKEHVLNLRKLGQLGNLNIHLPNRLRSGNLTSPKSHSVNNHTSSSESAAETMAETEKVVMQDPSLRPGDLFRLKSVKFPGYELGITSTKLQDDYFYLGLRKIGTSDAADAAWCMSTLFSVKPNALGVNVR